MQLERLRHSGLEEKVSEVGTAFVGGSKSHGTQTLCTIKSHGEVHAVLVVNCEVTVLRVTYDVRTANSLLLV